MARAKEVETTPLDRINAMKKRVLDAKKAREEAEQRARQIKINWNQAIDDLMEVLKPLVGIPVVQQIRADAPEHFFVDVRYREVNADKFTAKVCVGHESYGSHASMVYFHIALDEDYNPVILHDDEQITLDQALDLATAVVEAHFDEEAVSLDDPNEVPF